MCTRMGMCSSSAFACMPSMSLSDWCMLWATQSRKDGARSEMSERWLVEAVADDCDLPHTFSQPAILLTSLTCVGRDMRSEIADESFGTVIDKGTLDAILCGHDAFENAARLLLECSRWVFNTPATRLVSACCWTLTCQGHGQLSSLSACPLYLYYIPSIICSESVAPHPHALPYPLQPYSP